VTDRNSACEYIHGIRETCLCARKSVRRPASAEDALLSLGLVIQVADRLAGVVVDESLLVGRALLGHLACCVALLLLGGHDGLLSVQISANTVVSAVERRDEWIRTTVSSLLVASRDSSLVYYLFHPVGNEQTRGISLWRKRAPAHTSVRPLEVLRG